MTEHMELMKSTDKMQLLEELEPTEGFKAEELKEYKENVQLMGPIYL